MTIVSVPVKVTLDYIFGLLILSVQKSSQSQADIYHAVVLSRLGIYAHRHTNNMYISFLGGDICVSHGHPNVEL